MLHLSVYTHVVQQCIWIIIQMYIYIHIYVIVVMVSFVCHLGQAVVPSYSIKRLSRCYCEGIL